MSAASIGNGPHLRARIVDWGSDMPQGFFTVAQQRNRLAAAGRFAVPDQNVGLVGVLHSITVDPHGNALVSTCDYDDTSQSWIDLGGKVPGGMMAGRL